MEPMNVVLLAIDTLSARHMSAYGYGRETTPFIDSLAREGTLFERHYCQAIPTQPSYSSLYTGQYAVTHGIVSHCGQRDLAPDAPWLPEILQGKGYATCAIDNLSAHKKWFTRGYDQYIFPEVTGQYAQAEPCEQYNELAVPWLRQHADMAFFLFIHYWDTHTPYLPPERYRDLFYEGDPCDPSNRSLEGLWRHPFGEPWKRWFDQLQPGLTDARYVEAMYDSSIRYVDDGIKALVTTLDEVGVLDDTIVILFSDHGEMMFRHGIYFDHHGLYDPDIHVPLIVRWPDHIQAGTRIPYLVQHIDIAPTVLDAVGVEIPPAMEGTSLVPYLTGQKDEPIYPFLVAEECTRMMKWAIRTDTHKLIKARQRDYLHGPMHELYDLQADPGEMHNIAADQPDVVKELDTTLERWVADMMKKNGLTEDPLVANGISLGADWVKWVKEHGYW